MSWFPLTVPVAGFQRIGAAVLLAAAFFFPHSALAQCAGSGCDIDWSSCTVSTTYGGYASGTADHVRVGRVPFVDSTAAESTPVELWENNLGVAFGTKNVRLNAGFTSPWNGTITGGMYEITSCDWYCPDEENCPNAGEGGGDTYEVIPLTPEDPALLAQAFAWAFSFVMLVGLSSQVLGWLLHAISSGFKG